MALFILNWTDYAPTSAKWVRDFFSIELVFLPNVFFNSIALAIVVFFAQDLTRYFCHKVQHQIPWLWELHKFHHSALSLNYMTSFREHPLIYMMNNICNFTVSFVIGFFALLICPSVLSGPTQIGGGLLTFILLNSLGILGHYHRPISYGVLDKFIVSPAIHSIHHSNNHLHFNRNFGTIFTIWDWAFATFHLPSENELIYLNYGIDETPKEIANRYLPLRFLYCTLTINSLVRLRDFYTSKS